MNVPNINILTSQITTKGINQRRYFATIMWSSGWMCHRVVASSSDLNDIHYVPLVHTQRRFEFASDRGDVACRLCFGLARSASASLKFYITQSDAYSCYLSPLLHSVALVAIYIKSPLRIEVRIPCMAYLKDVISGYSTVPTPGSWLARHLFKHAVLVMDLARCEQGRRHIRSIWNHKSAFEYWV